MIENIDQKHVESNMGEWDFVYVTDLSDANGFIKANYPADHQFDNIFIRSHSEQDKDRTGGIRLTGGEVVKTETSFDKKGTVTKGKMPDKDWRFENQGLISHKDLNGEGSDWEIAQGKVFIEIMNRVSPNGTVAFTACGLAWHTKFIEAIASKVGADESFTIYANWNSTEAWMKSLDPQKGKLNVIGVNNNLSSQTFKNSQGWKKFNVANNKVSSSKDTNSDLKLTSSGNIEEASPKK